MAAFLALFLAIFVLSGLSPVGAQPLSASAPAPAVVSDAAFGSSFITPFPENDTYRLQVFGENIAEGLLQALVEALAFEPRVQPNKKFRQLANLFRGGDGEDLKAIETELGGNDAPHVAVVAPNMVYRFPWRENFDRRFPPGSEARREQMDRRRDEWKTQYGQRLDRLMRAFRKKNVAVYWLGLPIMRNAATTEDAQVINELIRERALQNGGKFIDVFSSFADENGAYSQQGPDIDGKPRVLREQDTFTAFGYRKLAHFVEREIKRDLALARAERVIPLAGSEAEQKRVRPATTVPASALPGSKGAAVPTAAKDGKVALANPADRPGGPTRASAVATSDTGASDVRADNSRITMKSVSLQGKEDAFTIEILRPSIPAPVLAAVTRRESADKASQMGDAVLLEIRGGQTLISSVSPSGEGGTGDRRRASSGSNSPLQIVLERGERLPAKPGRSDDMPWPRQEFPPQQAKAPEPKAGVRPAPGKVVPGKANQPRG